ncbi:hypothetical protein DKM44_13975 [Deinococcus irradiatisoli]|uniref:Uncharacterized protein n=2 Tax=Deinococcus irradiatisoli TaxID=2202254 RepID=A0A2Z3JU98_9DEIO|nr:hypothetical protein [Deinococcus irradiatisoli]AWN24698.1 hypothetical protein DKM44_13975 [Deinococcus irradiatisoli]
MPPDAPSAAGPEYLGVQFTLPDLGQIEFARVLRDLMQDAAFARPLKVRASEPRPGVPGMLTLAFLPADRERAGQAVQRLKTILLRYGAQVDQIRLPGER